MAVTKHHDLKQSEGVIWVTCPELQSNEGTEAGTPNKQDLEAWADA